jgi:aspartyl-tRNA(Asn)/glutamyl-tRNA(Gln) amidotransferase subunit C
MTQISDEDVRQLAQLSGIELSNDETVNLTEDISKIVEYVQQLSELDTKDVEPTYQVGDLENVWRDDELIDYGVKREDLLALAPQQQDNSIKVPKVL